MTVSHATITGSENHEPKGVESASLGFIYVANGSGSGTWRALTYTDFRAGPHVIIQDQKTTGTAPQTLTTGVNTRNLNNLALNYNTIASLSSNQFTLGAGTYYMDFWSAFASSGLAANARSYIRNITDSADIMPGNTVTWAIYYNISGSNQGTLITNGSGVVTIASAKTFELRMQSSAGYAGGSPATDGRPEIYSQVNITKLA